MMAETCNYTKYTTFFTWDLIHGCYLWNSWKCCSCEDTCNVNDLGFPFRKALDHLLTTSFNNSCNQKQVIDIDCKNTTFDFEGHLFVNRVACNKLNNDLRPTPENIISNCKCICGCKNVYCKFEPDAIKISTSSKPTMTPKSPITTDEETRTVGTTRTEKKTTSHEGTTKAKTTETIATSPSKMWTHQPSQTHPSAQHTTSSLDPTTFAKKAALSAKEDNSMFGATIGGAIGGVIFLLILAVFLLILIRRRRDPRKQLKQHDPLNKNGTFVNSTYEAEMDMNLTNECLRINSLCVSNGFDRGQETRNLSNGEQEYTQTTVKDKSQEYEVTDKLTNTFSVQSTAPENEENLDDYEHAKPISGNNTGNNFNLEPHSQDNGDVKITSQGNGGENYFVLEKENQSSGASNVDDVYNTLNENLKRNDDDRDDYHHLRDISRSGREGTNQLDEDADDYDMLKNGAKDREGFFNDDYDHCKQRKVPNVEDDYDHFT